MPVPKWPRVTIKFRGPTRGRVLTLISHEAPYPVIFVHGAGGNSLLWRRTLHYLSGQSLALAVDLPGHPVGDITCKTVSGYAEAVFEFIADREIERPVVCGHSVGGAVVLSLALAHPGELGGLILASTGAKLGVDPVILDGLRGQPLRAVEQLITPTEFQFVGPQPGEGGSGFPLGFQFGSLPERLSCVPELRRQG